MIDLNVPELKKKAASQGYVRRDLDELDRAMNVITDGAQDDTISSRMQRWKIGDVPKPTKIKRIAGKFMCWWLGKIQKDHDARANVGDFERAELEEQRTRRTLQKSGAPQEEVNQLEDKE